MTGAVRLTGDSIELELLPELGGRLHRLRAFGHDLLRTPDDAAQHTIEPFFWGGYHMAPWCNRIAAEPNTVGGTRLRPQANFSDGTAIHGRVYLAQANVLGTGEFHFDHPGDVGWPWPFSFDASFEAEGATLTVRQRLANRSDGRMPAGLGFHPWFVRPVDVTINAAAVYPTNSGSPRQAVAVAGALDARRSARLAPGVDATWTDVGDPPVRLFWPDLGIGATITFAAPTRHVVAAAPSAFEATAIEPQTHAPDGLRRLLNREAGALAVLEPGGELSLDIEIAFEQLPQEVSGG